METLIAIVIALFLDHQFGEPRRWHPLVGFGRLARMTEHRLFAASGWQRLRGIVAVALLLIPFTFAAGFISNRIHSWLVFDALVLYFALGVRSLVEHAGKVHHALSQHDRVNARTYTGYLVSRDTTNMDETEMSRATIESTLENGCDAVFAPLFWFAVGGAPAVLFYRLANTLDAMWGYRTTRYLQFGWAAARLDDLLNYIPARLTALTYACVGQFTTALHCWRTQAPACKSPNAGPVMSSGAGALSLQLGGPAWYHGKLEHCPVLGKGARPTQHDISQATRLLQRGILLWLASGLLITGARQLA